MNIVLATPPIYNDCRPVWAFPPLGLLYVATALKSVGGARVRIVDAFSERCDVEQALERILALSPDVFGLSATSQSFEGGWELIKRLKTARPGVTIIVGGIHATTFDRVLLREIGQIDLAMRGEAELSFPELCSRLIQSRDIAGVSGLSYRLGGEIVRGEPQMVDDIDALSFPDRGLLEYDGYGSLIGRFAMPTFKGWTTILSSRGCNFRCSFCVGKSQPAGRWRSRSPQNVVEELRQLARAGFKVIGFVDENFAQDIGRVNDLCTRLVEARLGIRFFIQSSLHHIPADTLELMHAAGCDAVYFGAESGSDAQLRRFRKTANRKSMAASIERAKKAHISVAASFITGAPGETDSDREATIQFVREVRPHFCETMPLTLHPGSELWDEFVGPEEPVMVQETFSRRINRVPGQPDGQTLNRWLEDFRKAFWQTLFTWARLWELLDLLRHNPLIRATVLGVLKNPRLILLAFKNKVS